MPPFYSFKQKKFYFEYLKTKGLQKNKYTSDGMSFHELGTTLAYLWKNLDPKEKLTYVETCKHFGWVDRN